MTRQLKIKIRLIMSDEKQQELPLGVKLSRVKKVKPSKLKENPLNQQFFRKESEEYFAKLTSDIKERGVIVPLIAKKDGTLLAGHNRLKIAYNIGLKKIPVQYVKNGLDDENEKQFVIKDNLLRRQLTHDDRIELYRVLYTNFNNRILKETRGGDRKSDKSKIKRSSDPLIDDILTAEKIAKEIGKPLGTVKRDLTKARKEIKSKDKNSVKSSKNNLKKSTINITALNKAKKALEDFVNTIQFENSYTVNKAIKEYENIRKKIQEISNKNTK